MAIPTLDFSTIGDLPQIYEQARMKAARKDALGQLGQGSGPLDYATTARALLASGDTEGGLTLARLAEAASRDQRDFSFRQQEAQRAQGNADRSFGLQQRQAADAARGFDYREVDDGQGGKSLVRINKATGEVTRPPIDGAQTVSNNPFMTGGKMNESQSKDALYASRMLNAEKVLRSVDSSVATNPVDKFRGVISDKIGYNIRTPEYQKFDQAQRDFINATLRRESGAVISDAEFDNANKQYFPQPGDTADTISQKRVNRMEAIRGIGAGAGPGYRPDSAFDASGNIVDNPAAKKQTQTSLPRLSSPAEAARLPKGTRFLDPNGVERVVP